MKGVVIYTSKYGATAQYAKWIGAAVKLPVIKAGDFVSSTQSEYDFVVLGSSVYVGRLFMKKWLRKNRSWLLNKKVFLFVVSGTPLDQKDKLESYISGSLPREAINKTDIHFMPGRLEPKKLSWLDHLIIIMGARLQESSEARNQMLTGYNRVHHEHIMDLVDAVTTFQMKSQQKISA